MPNHQEDKSDLKAESTVGSRFADVLTHLRLDRRIRKEGEIASATDYKPSTISEIKGNRQEPPEKILNYLESKYRVNKDYILRNEGGIYLPKEGGSETDQGRYTVSYLEQLRDLKNDDSPYLVPYVDIPAIAGYTKAYQQRDYIATLKKYPILPNVEPTGAIWRYFQAEGDSMENPDPKDGEDEGIRDGDILLCSQVAKEDWNQFTNLYTYIVVTEDQLLIKDVDRVMFEKEGIWVLISRNPNYEPIPIDKKEVRQLWLMRRHIRNRVKKHRIYDLTEIKKHVQKKLKGRH